MDRALGPCLHEVEIPTGPLGEARWIKPEQFDSFENERWVAAWRGGRQAQIYKETIAEIFGANYRFDIYDMRHRLAVRSIETNVNQSLCAASMGHTLQEHERRYQRWMKKTDLRAAMADAGGRNRTHNTSSAAHFRVCF